MPNLYFCQPHAQNRGMLRAVLSLADCRDLLARSSATYVGDEFPKFCHEGSTAADFAVLSVSSDETDTDWPPGYYRFGADLMEINEQLVALSR